MTATIGFWHNKNGQALIKSLNGSSSSTQLGNWLAATFPQVYGEGAEYVAAKANRIACPHCGEETFSEADFQFRGPGRPLDCPGCEHRVRTNWTPMLVFLAVILVPTALVAIPILNSNAKGLKYLPLGVLFVMLPVAAKVSKRFQRLVKA